jgi:hypothetical protein
MNSNREKRTVICHFYNEEYLLPWWLNHHKNIFDDGLMINYGSNDNSINIIKEICPSWRIVDTRNEFFGALEIDREIEDYEKFIDGYRVVLNVTEFLIGNFSKLDNFESLLIAQAFMIDPPDVENKYPDKQICLTKQRFFGISPFVSEENFQLKRSRLIHKDKNITYPVGRHYNHYDTKDFLIVRFDYAPWNEFLLKRKLQIGSKQPESDIQKNFGIHHRFDVLQHLNLKNSLLDRCSDLSDLIKSYEYWSY